MITEHLKNKQQDGFTILELMIAMTISSLILAACAAGFVQVSRMYYRGYVQAKTQELARQTIEDITKPIQFSGDAPVEATPVNIDGATISAICVGGRRYSFAKGFQLDDSVTGNGVDTTNKKIRHALWMDSISTSTGCTPLDITEANPPPDSQSNSAFDARELLSPYTRVSELSITGNTSNPNLPGLYQVNLVITYGDEDLIRCSNSGGIEVACSDSTAIPSTITCKGGLLSSQFCAISSLSTVVSRRLK